MPYDYNQTHEPLFTSAKQNFCEAGFRTASIKSICQEAGVTNGAFYAHFENKEELFSALVSEKLHMFNQTYQELSSMDITSSEDVLRIFEMTYGSIETLIHYVYSESEVFRLILAGSGGTRYEHFVNDLIDEECKNTLFFLENSKRFMKKPENISERLIKMGSSMVINYFFDAFLNGVSEADNIRETKLASDFCIAGYRELLGM